MASVLVVDDDAHIREVARFALARAGHAVELAADGAAAAIRIARGGIELVVLDILMPELDGITLCRQLGGRVPIVFLSSRGEEADRGREQRFCDAGRNDRKVGGLRLRDADERIHDAPDRTEQADERGGRTDRRKHRQTVLRAALNVLDGALDRHRHPVVQVDVAEQPFMVLGGFQALLGDVAKRAAGL